MSKAKKTAATSSPITSVTFMLDRSGSMATCKSATIEAFNAYVESLREDKGDGLKVEFTFLQFDSVSLDKVCVASPIKAVKLLSHETFQPRASTPLIDSCVKTIRAVEGSLTKRDDKPKVVICFQTDGQENCSVEHTWAELNALIKEKSEAGWQFNFMGAGIDAYAQAKMMGIDTISTVSYDHTNLRSTRAAFVASASNARDFGTGSAGSTAYTMQQRSDAGDAYAPADLKSKTPKPLVDDFSL